MIKEVYKDYFQKSFTFLYPLLCIKKKLPRPLKTFLFHPEYSTEDEFRLFCVYERQDSEVWKKFERDLLITHKMFENCEVLNEKYILYVFNLTNFKEDVQHLLNGRYSKFSSNSKKIITDYYGIHSPEWVYIESFLFPDKYYDIYSELLGTDVNVLKNIGELCSTYNKEKEIFNISVLEEI